MTPPNDSKMKNELPVPTVNKGGYRNDHVLPVKNRDRTLMLVMVSAAMAVGFYFIASRHTSTYDALNEGRVQRVDLKPWAMYAPYTPTAPYKPPPKSCQITQVNILQRNGAHYPNADTHKRIASVLGKLQALGDYSDPLLAFLNDYKYTLGVSDLVPQGAEDSRDAGETAYKRYQHLVRTDKIPFVRVSNSPRVIDSAISWTAGFADGSQQEYVPSIAVVVPEEVQANSTLHCHLCPAVGDSKPQTSTWESVFAPLIRDRLSSSTLLSPEQASVIQSLTDNEISTLMTLCPFESLAHGKSPFCELFSDDLRYLDYWGDIHWYYQTGYGQPLGRVQGVGYVNELIARLMSTPVRDHTQTNRTLNSNPLTFPLNRTVYVDFSHGEQMIAIYSALGLFKPPYDLDPTKIEDEEREWEVSRMIPFAGRMVVEKLDCQGEPKVRVLVNDRVIPLEGCKGMDGVCNLRAFVMSQSYALLDGAGDFVKCRKPE